MRMRALVLVTGLLGGCSSPTYSCECEGADIIDLVGLGGHVSRGDVRWRIEEGAGGAFHIQVNC